MTQPSPGPDRRRATPALVGAGVALIAAVAVGAAMVPTLTSRPATPSPMPTTVITGTADRSTASTTPSVTGRPTPSSIITATSGPTPGPTRRTMSPSPTDATTSTRGSSSTASNAPTKQGSSPSSKASAGSSSGSPRTTPSADARAFGSSGSVKITDGVRQGVVLIRATHDSVVSSGTGMVVTANGQVLTNDHVVRSAQTLTITVASTGKSYSASVIGHDPTHDVALLQMKGVSGMKPVTIGGTVELRDNVAVAGNAGGAGHLVANAGRVLATGQDVSVQSVDGSGAPVILHSMIETDAPASPGDSGGPLFDTSLHVVGMTTAGAPSSSGNGGSMTFAMPISDALAAADRLRR